MNITGRFHCMKKRLLVADNHLLEYIYNMKKKRVTRFSIQAAVLILVLLTGTFQIFADSSSDSYRYLHIVKGTGDTALMFNSKGELVEETEIPQVFNEGWIVVSDQEPVTLRSGDITIVLQKESILSVVSNNTNHLQYYLVGGSASFLTSPTFTRRLTVSTPIGIYEAQGTSEMFVSSDLSELIFSLGGSIKITNTISREIAELSPYHYLDLADPFLKEKPVSQSTFRKLSMNPEGKSLSLMPSAAVSDIFSPVSPAASFTAAEKEAVPSVPSTSVKESAVEVTKSAAVPVTAAEKTTEAVPAPSPVKSAKAASAAEKSAPAVEKSAPVGSAPEPVKSPVPAADEVLEVVYIAHTNDGMGALLDSDISYAALATLAQWGRNSAERTLLLDAGNTIGGSDITEFDSGLSAATVLETIGYDAIAVGTAEFTLPVDYLVQASEYAQQHGYTDILSSNTVDVNGKQVFTPYTIYDLDGITIGVIGISAPEEAVSGFSFYSPDMAAQAQELVNEIASQSDAVVVLGSLPASAGITAQDIAENIEGIDLIITGGDAEAPEGGNVVGSTRIVRAGEKLSSIGIVALSFKGGNLVSTGALSIDAEEIADPSSSALARSYGITSIPEDAQVASYLSSVAETYHAARAETVSQPEPMETAKAETAPVTAPAPEPAAEVKPVETAAPAAVTPEKKVNEPSAEEQPLTVSTKTTITADTEETPALSEYGVRVAYEAAKQNLLADESLYHGLSIKPYATILKSQIGLQGFYLTNGSIVRPLDADYGNLNPTFDEGKLETVRTLMSYVDYIYYGDETDPFQIVIDDHTPITYGNGYMVDELAVRDSLFEEKLGVYMRGTFGKLGFEAFADDLYLTGLSESSTQTGGARLSYEVTDALSFSLGSLINSDRSLSEIKAYPTLDAQYTLTDTRTRRTSFFLGLSTALDVNPFSIDTVFDSDGSDIVRMFPNVQATAGADLKFNNFSFRFTGSLINDTDPLLALGSLNSTAYSGSRMIEANGAYLMLKAEGAYTGENLSLNASYAIPIEYDFSRVLGLADDTATYADTLTAGISWESGSIKANAGVRRVGSFSRIEEMAALDSGLNGLLSDVYSFLTEDGMAQPYASFSFTTGIARMYADFLYMADGSANLKIGTELSIGKTLYQKQESTEAAIAEVTSSPFTFGFTADVHKGFKGGSDIFLMSLAPSVSYEGDNFSMTLAPYITADPSDYSLYNHSGDSHFTFGTEAGSTATQVYDIFNDTMSLFDKVRYGNEGDLFFFELSRDTTYSAGALTATVDSTIDADLQKQLAMRAMINTKVFNAYAYVNNLALAQFADLGISFVPLSSYAAEFGISSIVEARLSTGAKRVYAIPSITIDLPITGNQETGLALLMQASALIGYGRDNGFDVMSFDSSEPSLFDKLTNYLVYGGLEYKSDTVTAKVGASVESGMLSQNMYNSLYLRERSSLVDTFDAVYEGTYSSDGIDFEASADLTWDTDMIDFNASYVIPVSTSFALDQEQDLAQISASLDVGSFVFDASYSRRGFLDALTTDILDSSDSVVDRLSAFLLTNDSYSSVGAVYTMDNLELHARVGSYTTFEADSGSYNGVNAIETVPFVSFGMELSF